MEQGRPYWLQDNPCATAPDRQGRGEYEDFLTGFVLPKRSGMGPSGGRGHRRRDGALLVSDDGSNSIWRVSYVGE